MTSFMADPHALPVHTWTRRPTDEDRARLHWLQHGDPAASTGLPVHTEELLLTRMLQGWRCVHRVNAADRRITISHLEVVVNGTVWGVQVRCWAIAPGVMEELITRGVLQWTSHHRKAVKIRKRIQDPGWADWVTVTRAQLRMEGTLAGTPGMDSE